MPGCDGGNNEYDWTTMGDVERTSRANLSQKPLKATSSVVIVMTRVRPGQTLTLSRVAAKVNWQFPQISFLGIAVGT